MLSSLYLTKTNATDDILKKQLLYQIDFSIFMFPSLHEENKFSSNILTVPLQSYFEAFMGNFITEL